MNNHRTCAKDLGAKAARMLRSLEIARLRELPPKPDKVKPHHLKRKARVMLEAMAAE
jgi:hypothetical protein